MSTSKQDLVFQDTVKLKVDTSANKQVLNTGIIVIPDSLHGKKKEIRKSVPRSEIYDTVSVTVRNSVSDITFYDSSNIITRIDRGRLNGFPLSFIEKNRKHEAEARSALMNTLHVGKQLPEKPFHHDCFIFFIIIAAFLYASLPVYSKKLFPGATRFFLFRGIGEPESREVSELFHWQATLFNLVTFFNLALLIFCTSAYLEINTGDVSSFIVWAIAFGIIIVAVTMRHVVCFFTGLLSGKEEIFNEYIITVYQTYRYMGFISIAMVMLLAYTSIFSPKVILITGFVSFGVLYLMRTCRLLLIFMKRNVSILYLILYLCALEILPVAVVIKYVTGLF
jgi:hypothetical protein